MRRAVTPPSIGTARAPTLNPKLLVADEPARAWTPLRFPGQYHDRETGLHYNFHRYYDPETGRYLSHDPLGRVVAESAGGSWSCPSRPRVDKHPLQRKFRWEAS